jgi:hypothetical protein
MSADQISRQKLVIPNVVGMYLRQNQRGDMNASESVLDMHTKNGNSLYAMALSGYGSLWGIAKEQQAYELADERNKLQQLRGRRITLARDISRLGMLSKRKLYNVVLLNEGLEGLNLTERRQRIISAQEHTAPGGVNLVSGVMSNRDTRNLRLSAAKLLNGIELGRQYKNAGWTIEDKGTSLATVEIMGNEPMELPVASIIAHKPTA